MKLLSRVCADFTDGKGKVIYRIRPADRLVYKEDVPDAIRGDLLFKMLVADKSIEVIETAEQKKKLENDPAAGTDASGRKIKPAEPEQTETQPEVKPAKAAKAAKAESKPAEAKPAV